MCLEPSAKISRRIRIVALLICVTIFGVKPVKACFATPANQDSDEGWTAHWIGPTQSAGKLSEPDQWICYRKSFELADEPHSVAVRIAVDSRYWLWVNGKLIVREGGLKRGPNPDDTYYDTVDIGGMLRQGNNVVAILQCYWGVDGFSHKSSGTPGLIFELNTGSQTVSSDTSWKILTHPAFGHAGGRKPNMRISERPVRFDARLDTIVGWTKPEYSDGSWKSCNELGVPPSAPWNHLVPRPIPQWKDYGLKRYLNAAQIEGTISSGEPIKAQLPYNSQVNAWFKVDATAGQQINIDTDDPLNEIHTEYITRSGVQEFESPAWFNGHNVIYTIPKGIKILDLKYRETGFNTEFTGSFKSDDPFVNKLWEKCRRTLYVTMRDNFMDCPDRERGQWWGDAVNEIGETFYSMSPSSSLLARKAILNLMDWQRADGSIFSPVPAGNWNSELPTQMLASVGQYGFWNYYLYSGDLATIRRIYPGLKRYLALWKTHENGLVVHRTGEWDWLDWGDNIDTTVLDNAWYCLALEGAEHMASSAGYTSDSVGYSATRASVVEAVNRLLWDGSAYRDPAHNAPPDDRANALVVVAGIVPKARYEAVTRVLTSQLWASPYMEKYVLEALMLMNRSDLALNRMKSRYGPAVDSNLTTLPETFPMGGTMNHAWSGGPLTILSQYFSGIAPITPGFTRYRIRPQMGALNSIEQQMDTPHGLIKERIKRTPTNLKVEITSPSGTTGELYLPLPPAHAATLSVTINGRRWMIKHNEATSEALYLYGLPAISIKAGHTVVEARW